MRVAVALLLLLQAAAAREPLNVLHIISDDLRPELGAYGLPDRHTPNLDQLAADGTVFDRAYTQQGVCGPSRNSFLTGRRPDRSRTWNFINHFREDHPDWTTLPGMFLKAGRLSLAAGKSFHPKMPPEYDGDKSWSPEALPYKNPCWNTADYPKVFKFQDGGLPCVPCPADVKHYVFKSNLSVATEWCMIDAYEDTLSVDEGISLLRKVPKGKFFYLVVGMHKPHIPYQAAREDFDKHPLESVAPPAHSLPPTDMPAVAFHFTEGSEHSSWTEPIKTEDARAARRAYYASVTGMDRKLGKLFAELDSLGLRNSTAILFHSDHGYHLGEGNLWRKMTNFELVARVPLIVSVPGIPGGARSAALVELVDLYPTIAELAALPLPAGETFDGASFVPLLGHRPNESAAKQAAFSQYPRRCRDSDSLWKSNSILHDDRSLFTHMGYSVRTPSWRYTEWVPWNGTALKPVWDKVVARELYDHRNDTIYPTNFDQGELANMAARPESGAVVAQLSQLLRGQFGAGG
eukprot:TRINITY_DN71163_c0_g1_i1.p1 TRINITY_DN71163_c0_g1~~TRINITY_DN71163_c0_g1_i1.p1  ORF type:complete len:542 (+),score=174.59 TRINITY_DN71163_c0_g1_i1:70-1626(+)